MKITFNSIGVIHTPFQKLEDMPIQPTGSRGTEGILEIYPDFTTGLQDLDGFSHLYAIYYLHKVAHWKPKVVPFLDIKERGIFSTRSPARPNPIGLSLLEIVEVSAPTVRVRNVDMLDGTPLLDIKPYVPQFEPLENVRIGWLTGNIHKVESRRSDKRFLD